MNNPCLVVDNIAFNYPSKGEVKKVFENASFSILPGEVISILGENGSGKSTMLNLIAGFFLPLSGGISVDQKRVSMVFQDIGLLEWKNAFDNVKLGLISKNLTKEERKKIVEDSLNLMGVLSSANKLPKELSGGMRQRVALARALASTPKVLLLDEPFSALDWKTKASLQKELLRIIKKKKIGVVLVTHDLNEAVFFSDRVMMLSKGKLANIKLSSLKMKSKLINSIL